MIAATILLCALGHLVRDGWPILGTTHGARLLGGFLCMLGGFLLTFAWPTTLLGAALYAGFYADFHHGEGQRARNPRDALALAISGISSLAPLAAAAYWALAPGAGWLWLAGLVKPAVWFAAWRLPIGWSRDPDGILQPTRLAAITWGACAGGLLALLSAL